VRRLENKKPWFYLENVLSVQIRFFIFVKHLGLTFAKNPTWGIFPRIEENINTGENSPRNFLKNQAGEYFPGWGIFPSIDISSILGNIPQVGFFAKV
jgi:hypothetical protein